MAKTTVKNIAPGARGIYGADGNLVMIEKGESAELDVSAAERKDAEASGYFLFGDAAEADDGDLKSLRKEDLLKVAEAEGVAIETDDNKADLVRKIEEARAAS